MLVDKGKDSSEIRVSGSLCKLDDSSRLCERLVCAALSVKWWSKSQDNEAGLSLKVLQQLRGPLGVVRARTRTKVARYFVESLKRLMLRYWQRGWMGPFGIAMPRIVHR